MTTTIPTLAEELEDERVNSNARKAWEEALAQPDFENVGVIWCYSASTSSDHRNGRCCDFMVTNTKTPLTRSQQVQMGNRIRAYFVKHAARLHVQGIIWNHEVTGYPVEHPHVSNPDVDYRGPAGRARPYGGDDQHTDHNHVQLTGEAFQPLVPEKPVAWDGHRFPGAAAFHIGARGDYITLLGQRLVAHGWTGYVEGPGPVFTYADQAGVRWAQQQQGFTGSDADGIPGPQTWAWLLADPTPKPSTPDPTPEPTVTKIRVATFNVLKSTKADPFADRRDEVARVLRASKAGVFILQECDAADVAKLQDAMGPNYIWDREGANVVMVDKTQFDMGTEKVFHLPTPFSKGSTKACPLVRLTHRATGVSFWATSVHPSATSVYAKIATPDQMASEREQQAQFIVKTLDGIKLLVGGGDFNSSSMSPHKPKRVLADAGLKLLTLDPDFKSKDVDSFDNHTPGGQQIDEVFVRGFDITDGAILSGDSGSDHNLMWAELTIAKRS